MKNTNRKKYIESHWAIFVLKGLLATAAGLCLILSHGQDINRLTRWVGVFMAVLGIIELFNVFHRKHKQSSWGIPLAISIVELFVAAFMIFAAIPDVVLSFFPETEYTAALAGNVLAVRVIVLSFYTLYASIGSLLVSLVSFEGRTERFIWVIEGGVGFIMAACMLADNGLDSGSHLRIFGVYLLVKGVTDMIFGAHSRDEAITLKESQEEKKLASAKEATKAADKKSAKTNKKTSKK